MATDAPKTGPSYVDGIGSSQAIDTAGEIVDLAGIDCSSFVGGAMNWEHKSDVPAQIVGKILEYKKIFSEADCENDRHTHYWEKCKTPFLYVMGRLFDDKKESSKEVAALFADDAEHPDEQPMLGLSIEGSKVDKKGIIVTKSIARKMTITGAAANKQCVAELIPGPEAKQKSDDSIFKSEYTHVISLVKTEDFNKNEDDPKKLGQTRSGKPVLDTDSHPVHSTYTREDHEDAAAIKDAHVDKIQKEHPYRNSGRGTQRRVDYHKDTDRAGKSLGFHLDKLGPKHPFVGGSDPTTSRRKHFLEHNLNKAEDLQKALKHGDDPVDRSKKFPHPAGHVHFNVRTIAPSEGTGGKQEYEVHHNEPSGNSVWHNTYHSLKAAHEAIKEGQSKPCPCSKCDMEKSEKTRLKKDGNQPAPAASPAPKPDLGWTANPTPFGNPMQNLMSGLGMGKAETGHEKGIATKINPKAVEGKSTAGMQVRLGDMGAAKQQSVGRMMEASKIKPKLAASEPKGNLKKDGNMPSPAASPAPKPDLGWTANPTPFGNPMSNLMSGLGMGKKEKKKPNLKKAMTAGSGIASPGTLSGGAALSKESLDKKMKKAELLKRAKEAYQTWEKREAFENFMTKSMPDLTRGEIQAIGQTVALAKTLAPKEKANENEIGTKFDKNMAGDNISSYIQKKQKP